MVADVESPTRTQESPWQAASETKSKGRPEQPGGPNNAPGASCGPVGRTPGGRRCPSKGIRIDGTEDSQDGENKKSAELPPKPLSWGMLAEVVSIARFWRRSAERLHRPLIDFTASKPTAIPSRTSGHCM